MSPAHLSALSPSLSPSLPQDYPAIVEGLDLVQEDDQITHLLSLSDSHEGEEILNVFQEDTEYLANEDKYREIKAGELWVDPLSHTHNTYTVSVCLQRYLVSGPRMKKGVLATSRMRRRVMEVITSPPPFG